MLEMFLVVEAEFQYHLLDLLSIIFNEYTNSGQPFSVADASPT